MKKFVGWRALPAAIFIAVIATLALVIAKSATEASEYIIEQAFLLLGNSFSDLLHSLRTHAIFGQYIGDFSDFTSSLLPYVLPALAIALLALVAISGFFLILASVFWFITWAITRSKADLYGAWKAWRTYRSQRRRAHQEQTASEREKTADVAKLRSIFQKSNCTLNGYNYHQFSTPHEGPYGHLYSAKVDCLICATTPGVSPRGMVIIGYKYASGPAAGQWVLRPADFNYIHHAIMLTPRGLIWRLSDTARTLHFFVSEVGTDVPWYFLPIYSIAVFLDEYSQRVYEEKYSELSQLITDGFRLTRDSRRLKLRQARWFHWRNNFVFIRTLNNDDLIEDQYFSVDSNLGIRDVDLGVTENGKTALFKAIMTIDGINRYLFDRPRDCEYSEFLRFDRYDCIRYITSRNGEQRRTLPIRSKRPFIRLKSQIGSGFSVRNGLGELNDINAVISVLESY